MPGMGRPVTKIAPLLFCSGALALLYQMVWLREMRLVFGASTAASAAVLAMFMGGLGAGGLVLGKRVDRHPDPLSLYGNLELGVAALAGVTPFLVDGTRWLYSALGGTPVMGLAAGTFVRLLLSAVVLVPVTFLMGGTLPAAAKAAETDEDEGRRHLALLYGVNTLGAVLGTLFTTFLLLEVFGGRLLLWMGCLLNALVGIAARGIARGLTDERPLKSAAQPAAKAESIPEGADAPSGEGDAPLDNHETAAEETPEQAPSEPAQSPVEMPIPARFVLVAAAVTGLSFLWMELVFYRMLGPLLGGSTYTFGLILVVALLGLGLGGASYSAWFKNRPPTAYAFAVTCLLEALFLLAPFALGDRLALWALALRSLAGLGFFALASGWAAVTAVVVFPAAFIAGAQFPLLMALLGRGRRDVGAHVGNAYAWNTAGSILGSLSGGFGLIPWLSAPGLWRVSALALVALGTAAAALSFRIEKRRAVLVWPALALAACVLLVRATGPTAGFRHSPIGAGRSDDVMDKATSNSLRDWLHHRRRSIFWEADGVESSVALSGQNGYNFIVNGKVDGHARLDSGTQVMSGLIGAALHPSPKRALVVGLGTGSTAGWLGAVPEIERVDVIELEPAILRVARDCHPVSQQVLDNPKVKISIGDAREVLLSTKERYDIIFSEPSNPYRAGIASLFTKEVYTAVDEHLTDGGFFLQWLQAYDVDARTVRTVYATLGTVFPHVETWLTDTGDLVLLAGRKPPEYDVAALREKLAKEPFRSALVNVWRMTSLEGFLAHHAAGDGLTRLIVEADKGLVNTDDRNLLESAFARTVGREMAFEEKDIFELSIRRGQDRPVVRGKVDWRLVDDLRMAMMVGNGRDPLPAARYNAAQTRWFHAWSSYRSGDTRSWLALWESAKIEPRSILDLEIVAEAYAETGADAAPAAISALRAYQPIEADVLTARYLTRKGQHQEAANAAIAAINGYRTDPWPDTQIMERFLELVVELGTLDRAQGKRLFEALSEPFVVRLEDEERLRSRVRLAGRVDFQGLCLAAYSDYEPHVPFRHVFLRKRLDCYILHDDPRRAAAENDLADFLEEEATTLSAGLTGDLEKPADAPATVE